ncbi:MAG: DEAD/DEAH box helicase family protein [Bacteroidetes bacterium]|nr:DEAD/DEAH box helicase family protein [Bacteroidota bacterium]
MALTALKYQVEPIQVVKTALTETGQALCVMATGLGKTVVSAFVVEELLNMGYRGLFLCHENDILEQAEGKYREIIGNHIKYSTFYGPEKDWYADSAQMLFASFKSMNNHRAEWYKVFDPKHFDFMVVDESHYGQAVTYSTVIEYFDCMKLGLTATPDREDGRDIRDLFGEEVVNIPLEVGIARGWLTHIEYHVLTDRISNRRLKEILQRVLKNNERVSVKQLNESIFIDARTQQQRLVVEEYTEIKTRTKSKKTMIFCENIDHAEHVVQYFDRAGIIHSRRPDGENYNALKRFRTGELQYLISVDKMNEGIDVPDVEVVVFLRATDSKRVWYQQTGRGARKIPGKNRLLVLDFVANVDRLLMLRELMDRVAEEAEKDEELMGKLSKRVFNVSGEGFEFNFSDDLINLLEVIKVLKDGFYKTWQEASVSAIALGLKNYRTYKLGYKSDPRLPASPAGMYSDFPGYMIFFGAKAAPEGWMTAGQIAKLPGMKRFPLGIKSRADLNRGEHPEWFKLCASGSCLAEHYHPELVAILKEQFARGENPPEGWMTAGQISRLPNVQGKIKKVYTAAETRRTTNPEWFKFYVAGSKPTLHYNPDLVTILKKQFSRKERAPDGWMTHIQISRLGSVRGERGVVKTAAESYRQDHPEWFKMYMSGVHYYEHYHPDLVEILKKLLAPKEAPLEGWMNAGQISEIPEVCVTRAEIRKFAETYRESNLEWFKVYHSGSFTVDYYHPDLVMVLKEKFFRKEVPYGWMTANEVSELHDVVSNDTGIKQRAETFRIEHPHWFANLRAKNRRFTEHYHPDLVKILKKLCKKQKYKGKK